MINFKKFIINIFFGFLPINENKRITQIELKFKLTPAYATPFILENTEKSKYKGKERPEIELRKQQWMCLVEGEKVAEKVQCYFGQLQHVISSYLL